MNRELKRVATVVCCMFVALFAAATLTQYVNADSLAANPRNQRTLYESYSVQRGPILVNGTPIASSQPSKDQFKFIRTYANGPLYAPLTGYIPVSGTATGLESAENSMLSGTASNQFLARLNRLVSGQNPVGASVELTIDPTVQQAAWDALGNYTGSVVILEPSTGKVLAMVSKPSYNPNQLTVHDTAAANTAYETLLKDPGQPLINRAMNGNLDPPGSSFKVVVATAALESGKYQPDSSLPNPGSYVLPGTSTTIYNDSHGACGGGDTVTLANALRWSCNIPFAELGIALGDQVLRAQAEKFGFNSQFSIPMTSTASVFPPTRMPPN